MSGRKYLEKQRINKQTKWVGLIGSPVHHSLSPFMHNSLLRDLEINAFYLGMDLCRSQLPEFIKTIRNSSFIGFNVTVPFKEVVVDMVDNVDVTARQIGAINTV